MARVTFYVKNAKGEDLRGVKISVKSSKDSFFAQPQTAVTAGGYVFMSISKTPPLVVTASLDGYMDYTFTTESTLERSYHIVIPRHMIKLQLKTYDEVTNTTEAYTGEITVNAYDANKDYTGNDSGNCVNSTTVNCSSDGYYYWSPSLVNLAGNGNETNSKIMKSSFTEVEQISGYYYKIIPKGLPDYGYAYYYPHEKYIVKYVSTADTETSPLYAITGNTISHLTRFVRSTKRLKISDLIFSFYPNNLMTSGTSISSPYCMPSSVYYDDYHMVDNGKGRGYVCGPNDVRPFRLATVALQSNNIAPFSVNITGMGITKWTTFPMDNAQNMVIYKVPHESILKFNRYISNSLNGTITLPKKLTITGDTTIDLSFYRKTYTFNISSMTGSFDYCSQTGELKKGRIGTGDTIGTFTVKGNWSGERPSNADRILVTFVLEGGQNPSGYTTYASFTYTDKFFTSAITVNGAAYEIQGSDNGKRLFDATGSAIPAITPSLNYYYKYANDERFHVSYVYCSDPSVIINFPSAFYKFNPSFFNICTGNPVTPPSSQEWYGGKYIVTFYPSNGAIFNYKAVDNRGNKKSESGLAYQTRVNAESISWTCAGPYVIKDSSGNNLISTGQIGSGNIPNGIGGSTDTIFSVYIQDDLNIQAP